MVYSKQSNKLEGANLVKQYEQTTFLMAQEKKQPNDCATTCKDRYGNVIHIGDYVKSVVGLGWCKLAEGYVSEMFLIEEAGIFLKIVNSLGRTIAEAENPRYYYVVEKE